MKNKISKGMAILVSLCMVITMFAVMPIVGYAKPGITVLGGVLQIGETMTVTAVITGAEAGSWTSGDTSVVTITADTGAVTAVGAGTTTISHTTSIGGSVTSTSITVYEAATITNPEIGTVKVNAGDVTPTGFAVPGDGQTIVWVSSATVKATIDALTGVITPVAEGDTTISYKVTDTATGRIVAKGSRSITVQAASSVDKSTLTAAIDSATVLIGSKTVGVAVGNVSQEAHDAFQSAIDEAQLIAEKADAIQTEVDDAAATLATAATVFNSAVIAKPATADVMKIVLTEQTTGNKINVLLNLNTDYNIDIPDDPSGSESSYSIAPDPSDPENAVVDVIVKNMQINGSSSSGYNDREIHFASELGAIVLKLEVKLSYGGNEETRLIILNLFQPKYKGITVTPNVIAGDENILGITHAGCKDGEDAFIKNVFIGADSVTLSLPSSINNKVKSFSIIRVEGDGALFVQNGPNNYTITLSSHLTCMTKVFLDIVLDGGSELKTLYIEELAIFQNGEIKDNYDFIVSASYNADPSFPIVNPRMLVVYYHEYGHFNEVNDWIVDDTKVLGTDTKTLPGYDINHPVTEIELVIGNVDFNETDDANRISVFLVSGDINVDDGEFDGVEYGGNGNGWTDILPNHPLVCESFKNGGKK